MLWKNSGKEILRAWYENKDFLIINDCKAYNRPKKYIKKNHILWMRALTV